MKSQSMQASRGNAEVAYFLCKWPVNFLILAPKSVLFSAFPPYSLRSWRHFPVQRHQMLLGPAGGCPCIVALTAERCGAPLPSRPELFRYGSVAIATSRIGCHDPGIALLVAGCDSRENGGWGAVLGLRHRRRTASNGAVALHSLYELLTKINLLAEP